MKQPRIFILTGAGTSAESGLRTFRDAGGLWEGHKVEDVATPGAFASDPDLVHHFYNMRRKQLETVQPNAAHTAIAELQQHASVTLVTQNVDNLHERAGSTDVIHMHGELLKKRCAVCETVTDCFDDLTHDCICADCGSEGRMRPHIVWFGEMPLFMDEIYNVLTKADIFVAIGTSGMVYPAAGFAEEAKRRGAKCIEINLADTKQSGIFDQHIIGPASETVPAWTKETLAKLCD